MSRFHAAIPAMCLAWFSGCSPPPCTVCLQVAGTYDQPAGSNTNTCDNHTLTLYGADHPVFLSQNGSQLTLNSDAFTNLEGQLHEDSSASFGPIAVAIQLSSGDTLPGHAYLDGWFSGPDGGVATSFEGAYSLVTDADQSCEVSNSVTWSR